MLKNYLEFGSIKNNQKRRYEIKKGNLYDWYMLPRYFNDLHILDKFTKSNNLKKLSKKLHHKEDLKFNFTILLLLKVSKFRIFYEFGQTLFEKIYFLKVFSNYFNIRNLKKIRWRGNDISEMFNFFCKNFYKNLDIKVFNKLDKKSVKKLINCLKNTNCNQIICISTVDVYSNKNSSERSYIKKNHLNPYGFNRLLLNNFIKNNFKNYLIIKLPSLFGNYEKKGFFFDLIKKKKIEHYNKHSKLQWYYTPNLIKDIKIILKKNIREINLVSEPISCLEVAKKLKINKEFNIKAPVVEYKIKSIHNFRNKKYSYKIKEIIKSMKKYLYSRY